MDFDKNIDFEGVFFSCIDEVKNLISSNKWNSAFLDYSKNEILALLFLYRFKNANMTEISKYINAPLNTTTGVVNRLEKKKMVERIRSSEDRRVVQIILTDKANKFINKEKEIIITYFKNIYEKITIDEKVAAISIFTKVKQVLAEDFNKKEDKPVKKIRKISIE